MHLASKGYLRQILEKHFHYHLSGKPAVEILNNPNQGLNT
jgi:hypothetical protein